MAGTQRQIDKHFSLWRSLFPKGKLWDFQDQPNLSAFFRALSEEPCRWEVRAKDILREMDPNQTVELLVDFERLLGLPDECTPAGLDFFARRDQVVQKLTNQGGISKTYFEFLGAQLGFTIEVNKALNFVAGRARAGDKLTNYFNRHFIAGTVAGTRLTAVGWRSYFTARLPISSFEVFEAGDVAGTPLREFTNPLLECTIRKLKPAESAVFFTYE